MDSLKESFIKSIESQQNKKRETARACILSAKSTNCAQQKPVEKKKADLMSKLDRKKNGQGEPNV